MNRKWLIVGSFGAGNLGDDAILAGILSELEKLGQRGPVLVSGGPLPFGLEKSPLPVERVPHAPSGILSFLNLKRRFESRNAMRSADRVIIGGGGLFTDQESLKAPVIWSAQARALRSLRKDYVMLGQSLGPLLNEYNQHLTRETLEHARHVQVRDQLSEQLAKDMGRDDVALGVDWALPWLVSKRATRQKKNQMTVILRSWPGFSTEQEKLLSQDLQRLATSLNLECKLLSLDCAESVLDGTLRPLTVEAALREIAQSKLVVSMRLHGALMGISQSVPTLALSYSPKVENTLSLLGLESGLQVLQRHQWSQDHLLEALQKLSSEPVSELKIASLEKENQKFLKRAFSL